MTDDPLQAYRDKRNFDKTSEPAGISGAPGDEPRFVIQKHAASSLHYDFRLEVDGALRSWAVPKGPSTDPQQKRLAVPTEDHPLAYADFEGEIPAGEYGGGTVLIWDEGIYRNLTKEGAREIGMAEALARGHATFRLSGKKLRGGFALTRFRTGKKESWLLVKVADAEAAPGRDVVAEEPRSVRSGRTLEEIAGGEKG